MHRSVVFPEPDGPTIATTSPRATESETPWSTGTSCLPVAVGLRHISGLEHAIADRLSLLSSCSTSEHQRRVERSDLAKRQDRGPQTEHLRSHEDQRRDRR